MKHGAGTAAAAPARGAWEKRVRGPRVRGLCNVPVRSALLGALVVSPLGCTFTSQDFEPPLVERAPLAAAAPPIPEISLTPSSPAAPAALSTCAADLPCPQGFDCSFDPSAVDPSAVDPSAFERASAASAQLGLCVPSVCVASERPAACIASWCDGGNCGREPCSDGELGPGEADVDCGGACAPCALGSTCAVDSDCAQGGCVVGQCAEPSCSDAVRNGGEQGIDCGGTCGACADGQPCAVAADCQSRVCGACEAGGRCCAPPSCADGVLNGAEVGLDCGGSCGACPLGSVCTAASDCVSNVCQDGRCSALCNDAERDGDEGAVDCGGSEAGCPRCADGQTCAVGADCSSGRCDGVCISCLDGVENGDEAGLDCGSSELGCPACPRCDEESSVALGPVGSVTALSADGCAMLARFANYAPTLIESYAGGPFPLAFSWRQECTGLAGDAVFERQFQQIRIEGLGISCPIFFDLGGGAEPLSLRWY